MTLPATQKAIVFETSSGPLLYKDVPLPTLKPNEILVNVKYSGVCHSDLHAWKGDWPLPTKLPLIGGHEGAGVVVAIGSDVKNFTVGDKAGIKWINKICQTCEYCVRGLETGCEEQDISGYTMDGTFQQYCVVDSLTAAKFPHDVDLSSVAPLLCAGLTSYKALKSSNLKQGQWCAIIGAGGGLGSYAVQYANAMGFRVIGIDSPLKKDLILNELKAEVFIDFTTDIVTEINELTNGGAHAVINFSANQAAMNLAPNYVRKFGTYVVIGMPKDGLVNADINEVIEKQLKIVGSSVGSRADCEEALDFFYRGLIKSQIQVFPLNQVENVFKLMESGGLLGRAVLDTSNYVVSKL